MHNGNRPASHSHNRSTSCTPSHAQNRHNRQHKSQQIKVTRQRQKRNINELNHLQCSSETASKIATEILSTSCKWRHEWALNHRQIHGKNGAKKSVRTTRHEWAQLLAMLLKKRGRNELSTSCKWRHLNDLSITGNAQHNKSHNNATGCWLFTCNLSSKMASRVGFSFQFCCQIVLKSRKQSRSSWKVSTWHVAHRQR